MPTVERLQEAIDKLETLKAASDPIRHDSTWVVDYDIVNLEHQRVLVLDSHNGGYDGSIVAEVTTSGRAKLIVTLHRTIDAQLRILNSALRAITPVDGQASFDLGPGSRAGGALDLADAILGEDSK